jgi:hypothetical protein
MHYYISWKRYVCSNINEKIEFRFIHIRVNYINYTYENFQKPALLESISWNNTNMDHSITNYTFYTTLLVWTSTDVLSPHVKMLVIWMLSCVITLLMMSLVYLYFCCYLIHLVTHSFFFLFIGAKVYMKQLKEISWMLIVCGCWTLTWFVYCIALPL